MSGSETANRTRRSFKRSSIFMNIKSVQEKIDHIHYEQEVSIQAARQHFFRYVCLEMEKRNIESSYVRDSSPPEMQLISLLKPLVISFFDMVENTSIDEPPPVETFEVDSRPMETSASPQAEAVIVTESANKETTNPSHPGEESPERRLEKHFGPARSPIISALGYILDFSVERRIRFVAPDGNSGTIILSQTEWETALALLEANGDGLTNIDLALKVALWRGKVPTPEAVQRMVSRITGRFENAGMPFRGRTENVHPSSTPAGGPILSKKRRPGRPPKPGDGEFRAYLHELSPLISSC